MHLKHFYRLFVTVFLFLMAGSIFAQIPDNQDTVLVPFDYVNDNGNTQGSLNQFIADDKADGGIPEGRVYLLERSKYYFLSGTISLDFSFRLVGQTEPADSVPAIVAAGYRDGQALWQFFKQTVPGTVEFKNIYFKGASPVDALSGECIRVVSDSVKLVADNCIFDSFHFVTLHFFKVGYGKAFVTNCYFRNLNHKNGGKYNGRGLRFMQSPTPVDTIVMQNNTFVNSNSFFLDVNRFTLVNYALIDHNTIVNTVKFVFQWHWQSNAFFTNNLIYNGHSYGETEADASNQDPDGLVFGIFGIDTVYADSTGITDTLFESSRNVVLTNNCWYYDSAVQSYWDARDSVMSEPFLNSRSQAMFDDNDTWPGLVEENNINSAPNFTNFTTQTRDDMITYMEGDRDGTDKENNWGWYPDRPEQGYVFKIYWPLNTIEDFSYSTSDDAYTAGIDGYPIGDLNWFPDRKADWITAIDDDITSGVAREFSLQQNYPNPFNPTTNITYTLAKNAQVKLTVYNVLGQKIKTLINSKQTAGSHTVVWNGLNEAGVAVPSGVYFYRLETRNGSQVRKMMLLK